MARRLCVGMVIEYVLPDRSRVDCLTAEYAIEIDWTEKWAEAIGQALYYASATNRKPAIILICHQSTLSCLGHGLRMEAAIAWWRLPVSIWRCDDDALSLADCYFIARQ